VSVERARTLAKKSNFLLGSRPPPILSRHKQPISTGLSYLECYVEARRKDQTWLPNAERYLAYHETIETDGPDRSKPMNSMTARNS
jgi:hypothetical protein